MKNRKLAAFWFVVAIIAFLLALFGRVMPEVMIAVGIISLILSYAANQKALTVDPYTGVSTEPKKKPNEQA